MRPVVKVMVRARFISRYKIYNKRVYPRNYAAAVWFRGYIFKARMYLVLSLLFWQGEPAGSAFIHSAFKPDSAVVTLDDALTDSKSDTVARKLATGMKTLEYLKKAIGVAHVKAGTIVFAAKHIVSVCYGAGEIN